MQKTFSISVPAETRTLHPKKDGRAEVTYTVTNNKPHPARARVQVAAKDGADNEWFQISGNAERDFGAQESQQFKVAVAIPADTPAGTYGFRIDAVNVANPQEDFSEGDLVSVQWQPPAPEKRGIPFWLIPAVISFVILGVAIGGLLVFLRTDEVEVPDVSGKTYREAKTELEKHFTVSPVLDDERDMNRDVLATDPRAGTFAASGHQVVLRLKPLPDGWIEFFCEGGYVARFVLTYKIDGILAGKEVALSLGQRKRYLLPGKATSISVTGQISGGADIFKKQYSAPPNKILKVYGTIFSPQVVEEPEAEFR